MKMLCFISTLLFGLTVHGQQIVSYTLTHTPNSKNIEVAINFEPMKAEEAYLIIPRSAPGCPFRDAALM